MMTKEQKAIADSIMAELADRGQIIEGGWQVYLKVGIPATVPAAQKAEMRNAYYLGAQHLFASILSVLEPDSEPTEKDLERMSLIQKELDAFTESFRGFYQPI